MKRSRFAQEPIMGILKEHQAGMSANDLCRKSNNTLVKALSCAFRWKRMLESGDFTTINELAEREGIAPSYITRVLRLTQLERGIVEAVLDGREGPEVTLARLLEPFPVEWERQIEQFE